MNRRCIRSLARRPPRSARRSLAWWRYHPDAFRIVRDRDGGACGLVVMIRASDLNEAVDAADPVAAAWRRDVVPRGLSGYAVLPALARLGRWRSSVRVAGSFLGGSEAVVRGNARNAALGLHRDRQPRAVRRGAGQIGIPAAAEPTIDVGGQTLYSGHARHGTRIGRCLVDEIGWSRNHGGGSRVFESARCRAHELILSSGRVGLTSLEFGVMQYPQERPGKAVGRYDLMEAVWGHRNPTASNVVDVVVRSLRRKLGADAASVETVRGTGYRYRVPIH